MLIESSSDNNKICDILGSYIYIIMLHVHCTCYLNIMIIIPIHKVLRGFVTPQRVKCNLTRDNIDNTYLNLLLIDHK